MAINFCHIVAVGLQGVVFLNPLVEIWVSTKPVDIFHRQGGNVDVVLLGVLQECQNSVVWHVLKNSNARVVKHRLNEESIDLLHIQVHIVDNRLNVADVVVAPGIVVLPAVVIHHCSPCSCC